MSEENMKMNIIKNSVDGYKKLPKDKQMYVLGFMQGVLLNHQEEDYPEATNRDLTAAPFDQLTLEGYLCEAARET